MTQTLLPSNDLPTIIPAMARSHRWDHDNEKRIAACDAIDGNARNIKSCYFCGMMRITVMPPHANPWHEWRTPEGAVWLGAAAAPVCRGGE
jgi:hypothetical protein